jgi:hypothetical protein
MRILKKGNGNTSLAYTSLVRLILEYGTTCWDPYRKRQINALDRVQNIAAKFEHHRNDSNWETLTQRRKVALICALLKAYARERAWKAIGDRLQRPCYLSRVDHDRKIGSRKQTTDIGKYSSVNRTIQLWNQLPADVLVLFYFIICPYRINTLLVLFFHFLHLLFSMCFLFYYQN